MKHGSSRRSSRVRRVRESLGMQCGHGPTQVRVVSLQVLDLSSEGTEKGGSLVVGNLCCDSESPRRAPRSSPRGGANAMLTFMKVHADGCGSNNGLTACRYEELAGGNLTAPKSPECLDVRLARECSGIAS